MQKNSPVLEVQKYIYYICNIHSLYLILCKNCFTRKTTVFSDVGLAFVAVSALSVAGCNKPDLPEPMEEDKQVELVDGLKMTGTRLSFDGPREFEEAMDRLQANPDEFAKKISMAGFRNADHHLDYVAKKTSRVYKLASAGALQDDNYEEEEIAEEEKPISVDELVEDPLFRSVLNEKLEVEVELQYASPYGVARCDNQWKGTVIEKSN